MTSTAPDFSSTFEIVDDKLADVEKRLVHRRSQHSRQMKNSTKAKGQEPDNSERAISASNESTAKRKRAKQESVSIQIVAKEVRQNLTLKVLATNEAKFHQLFHKLQLKGDSRKKQDLADDALELLFAKYAKLL